MDKKTIKRLLSYCSPYKFLIISLKLCDKPQHPQPDQTFIIILLSVLQKPYKINDKIKAPQQRGAFDMLIKL